ncbi:MAG: ABC-F family ATP-binding cassette domain-containing protein, partial [Chloroflexi bacterium]|nr:ABC-F family ATP-binding cassette domain-containing protein [Chloroflexota bacterium]
SGRFRVGANVLIGYAPQGHTDLRLGDRVLDSLLEIRNLPLSEARTFLGRYLFSGDDVFKLVGDLSGGERSRVALARLALRGANLLILDEPTTHLDIASREVLEAVLSEFNGTILFVSHDRYFVDSLADVIWWLEEGELVAFNGTYQEFREARTQEQAAPSRNEKAAAPDPRAAARERRRERAQQARQQQAVDTLEAEAARLGQRLEALDAALAEAALVADPERIRALAQERQEVEAARLQAEDRWAQAADTLLAMQGEGVDDQ